MHEIVSVSRDEHVAVRVDTNAARRVRDRLRRRKAAITCFVLARRADGAQAGKPIHDSGGGIYDVDDAVDVIRNEDIPEGVNLYAAAARCTEQRVDCKAAITIRIARFNTRGQVGTLRTRGCRHGRCAC
jgi:hypothetical protein